MDGHFAADLFASSADLCHRNVLSAITDYEGRQRVCRGCDRSHELDDHCVNVARELMFFDKGAEGDRLRAAFKTSSCEKAQKMTVPLCLYMLAVRKAKNSLHESPERTGRRGLPEGGRWSKVDPRPCYWDMASDDETTTHREHDGSSVENARPGLRRESPWWMEDDEMTLQCDHDGGSGIEPSTESDDFGDQGLVQISRESLTAFVEQKMHHGQTEFRLLNEVKILKEKVAKAELEKAEMSIEVAMHMVEVLQAEREKAEMSVEAATVKANLVEKVSHLRLAKANLVEEVSHLRLALVRSDSEKAGLTLALMRAASEKQGLAMRLSQISRERREAHCLTAETEAELAEQL